MEKIDRKRVIELVLALYPDARKVAVENFLFSCPMETDWDYENARANLEMDRQLYRWKTPTVYAIQSGLDVLSGLKTLEWLEKRVKTAVVRPTAEQKKTLPDLLKDL